MHAELFQEKKNGQFFLQYWKITVFKLRIDIVGLHSEAIY